jgi:hypothetical protein
LKAGIRALLVCALAALVAGAVVAPAGARDGAGEAAEPAKRESCYQGSRDDLSASYVYKISARNLSCDRAVKLVKQYHQCRHDNGGWNGKCGGFKGFSCSQKKLDSTNTVLQAKGKCAKGSQKFVNVFSENRR